MINYDRINLFFELKKDVHISCDGKFYNGIILDVNVKKKFLILKDIKLGEVPIMFEDILSIEPYIKKVEWGR